MITNYEKLCVDLEKQELEAPSGVTSVSVYSQLLAIYLFQNDLCNAKLLWKRIPQNITSTSTELSAIWTVGQKMWKRDLQATYNAIHSHSWSEPMVDIMRALEEKVRERALILIGRSYSSISLDTVAAMTGLNNDAAAKLCFEQKWELVDNGLTVIPKPAQPSSTIHTSSEDQLFKLTDFVTFLEN